jgi:hypothetical protein
MVHAAGILSIAQEPPSSLASRLQNLNTTREAEVEGFARGLAQASRQSAQELVRLWAAGSAEQSRKAVEVLSRMEETAVVPLIGYAGSAIPAQDVWMIRTAVQNEIDLRLKLVRRIDRLLEDRRTVTRPTTARPVESAPPVRRVCDNAYVLVDRFLDPAASAETRAAKADQFLGMPDPQRDAEIRKLRASRTWKRLLEEAPE